MRILISADMEGATGVTWPADCEPGAPEWERCRPLFTSDVNAAIEGFFDGGASEVLVNEAHSTMRNLLLEELDPRATMITGRHKELTMVEGIQRGAVDGVAFLGYHTAAGTQGVLSHTYIPGSLTSVLVNGRIGSEGLLNAHVAAAYGVPVVLITGDDRTCADAATYAPQARTVAVKDYVARYTANCRPPARTHAQIKESAAAAMSLAGQVEGVNQGPFTVQVETDATQLAEAATVVPTVVRTGDRTVEFTSATAYDMIRCFKAVCTLVSAATEHRYG
ncbi:M55 family metallopeptidase [Pseudactinotalea sp. Z1748]|uniref:M55 family metallopeptidase n=1 Tax=Pseudactinotalea sp. Z1748 TaxID=3413027 RepID=UPI003C7B7F05